VNSFSVGLKRLVSMVFKRNPSRLFAFARSSVDWLSQVGDGTSSSTVMAPVLWIARTFPEAPPCLWQQLENGQEEQVRDHDVLRLLQRPNDHYTGPILWMATLTDWTVDGNAYWLKIRDRTGIVRQLWWVPHWLIEPKSDENDSSVFISYYEYKPGDGQSFRVDPSDVVHFRFGLDADDPRKGYSPLKSVLREVFTDDEAAAFTASLLRNMGVPGLLVSPKDGADAPSEDDAKAAKMYLKDAFGGDRRGEPLVMMAPTEIAQFGFSPEQLVLKDIRRIPEERVTAVLGVPAIVAGLGAGLDRSTFTNMAEAREAAYESGIIPTQRILAEDIRFQLVTEFINDTDIFAWRFGFDLSKVRVLQEDLYRQAQRHDLMIRGGWEMVIEGRRGMGLEVDNTRDQVFLRPMNITTVPADTAGSQTEPPGYQATTAAVDQLTDDVGRLTEQVRVLEAKPATDPEILAFLTDLAVAVRESNQVARDNAQVWAEAKPVDPALVALLTDNAAASRESADGYARGLSELADAVRSASTMDDKLLALVTSVAHNKPRAARATRDTDGSLIVTYENSENGKKELVPLG
jgi:HK97 family phage portal protein